MITKSLSLSKSISVFLNFNRITNLPDILNDIESLRYLKLNENLIDAVFPEAINKVTTLNSM
ncbi:hypothetical protein BCR32DRAFT_285786 [Anaeromyces robustus]|uniref:L domain-like protein n=1 Tax=Anaeromyces robustus TaxID=1754192 RepID=A0A1Y1WE01_9FUNG|nr:hypothetical protein BCR32DRAFT_285786 [Anaeromyces robustus]|eukprot:ORX71751.1 hypothetical protein BCR32DRAFT_285786 [Anaeromyces robustus]